MKKPRWWRGLLARVTLANAIGALLLATTVAGATYGLALNRLLADAEGQHRDQSFFDARVVSLRLAALPEDATLDQQNQAYGTALASLPLPNASQAILLLPDGSVRSENLQRQDIPASIQAKMLEGLAVAQQRFERDGEASYWVGVNLAEFDIIFFEVVGLGDLEATLRSLRRILFIVAVAASVAGAMLGYYSARRALAPVPRISGAALAIADGDFETKLDMEADRDLAALSSAFNDMVDAVSTRIEREQRFTSDVSHELRSPLMTLTASVEVLERRKESLPDVAQQAIDLLSQDLRRFQRLVEDLLEISRLEAGAVQLQLSRFILVEFLENAIAQSHSLHLALEFSPSDANVALTADKRRLFQVMTNLIENAEKHGGGAIGISFEVVGPNIQIVVDDAGPGVPADQRERIFERFGRIGRTAGNRATATGFGLGLSLVAEHIRIHGGSVWVTDRVDGEHGARFVVQLPVGEHIDVVEEMAL